MTLLPTRSFSVSANNSPGRASTGTFCSTSVDMAEEQEGREETEHSAEATAKWECDLDALFERKGRAHERWDAERKKATERAVSPVLSLNSPPTRN
jgi:hypothetical protein